MAEPTEKVRVLKQESAALGGGAGDDVAWPEPIDPREDALVGRGLYLEPAGSVDGAAAIWRDDANNIKLKDPANPAGATLTELLASSTGISETTHRTLRQLIHLAEAGGPGDGFAPAPVEEQLPTGDPFPTSSTWWDVDPATPGAKKISRQELTYNANKTIATEKWIVYDSGGVAISPALLDTYVYSGIFVSKVNRTFPAP